MYAFASSVTKTMKTVLKLIYLGICNIIQSTVKRLNWEEILLYPI